MTRMLPVTLLLLLFMLDSIQTLKICSFNVRSFGAAKRDNSQVMDVIVKIIRRCDIMLLMEIKDSHNIICPTLMKMLNGKNMVSVKKSYHYHDAQNGDEDAFSREPFVVWFYSPQTAVTDFVIIPLHTTPETSVREIDELFDVYMDLKRQWKPENFIFMGDFNAGCNYVPKKSWKDIRLRMDPKFVWLIGDHEDTTVKGTTKCAYDRIVLQGQKINSSVVPDSASIFDFQKAYRMTEEEALDISDHFPVEFELQPAGSFTGLVRSIAPKKRGRKKSQKKP
ncbi:deoxyribonuclease gamma isoform X2 [Gracilinanus agilis]|uniref:deoxyribonuclease gamma isoform X2 n=1 Tax=Gracilinanus agilis TaxID=191870 RepID=UPI001CFE0377|nr:deoxyribonuclease gamma isoform X2 [Gracilinanus agilis]